MSSVKIEVKGINEQIKALQTISQRVAGKALRKGLKTAGKVILEEMKALVPTDTRELKKSLGIKVKVWRGGPKHAAGAGSVKIGPRSGHEYEKGKIEADPVKYAHFDEYGTEHARAQPFIRPALDSKKDAAMSALAGVLEEALRHEVGDDAGDGD